MIFIRAISCDQEIRIETGSKEIARYLLQLNYIYNIPFSSHKVSIAKVKLPCINVIDDRNTGIDISELPDRLKVTIDWQEYNCSSSLVDIILEYIFLCLIERNIVLIHAATIVKNGDAYLICGPSGSGKTSISQNLCFQLAYQWISDDQTYAQIADSQINILPTHDLITLRKPAFTKTAPIAIQNLGLNVVDYPCQPRKLFFPIITNSCVHQERLSSAQTATLIYNEITKFLNGFGTYFIDNSGVIQGEPIVMRTARSWNNVRQLINRLAVDCLAYKISGSITTISTTINSIVNE